MYQDKTFQMRISNAVYNSLVKLAKKSKMSASELVRIEIHKIFLTHSIHEEIKEDLKKKNISKDVFKTIEHKVKKLKAIIMNLEDHTKRFKETLTSFELLKKTLDKNITKEIKKTFNI